MSEKVRTSRLSDVLLWFWVCKHQNFRLGKDLNALIASYLVWKTHYSFKLAYLRSTPSKYWDRAEAAIAKNIISGYDEQTFCCPSYGSPDCAYNLIHRFFMGKSIIYLTNVAWVLKWGYTYVKTPCCFMEPKDYKGEACHLLIMDRIEESVLMIRARIILRFKLL